MLPAGALIGAAAIGAGGSILGGMIGGKAAKRGAAQMAQAQREATALQRQMYETGYRDLSPYREVGQPALNYMQSAASAESPLYQMRMQDTIAELNRQMAARGQYFSGAAMQNVLGDATRRITAEEAESRWGRNALLGQMGYGAAAGGAQLGQQYAGQAGQTMMQGASGIANQYNQGAGARQNALAGVNQAVQGGIGNYYFGQYANALQPQAQSPVMQQPVMQQRNYLTGVGRVS